MAVSAISIVVTVAVIMSLTLHYPHSSHDCWGGVGSNGSYANRYTKTGESGMVLNLQWPKLL
eukprot:1703910-Ditylum_brightwellii.AAC.1